MITLDELHQEAHEITDISNVFLYLIENRKMCDSKITCNLFFDYVEKVKCHLDVHDTKIYALILKEGDEKGRDLAENFLSGSIEIKRIFQEYLKKWSKKGSKKLHLSDHDAFVDETKEIFGMVLNRIQHETEQLYPLVSKLDKEIKKVA